MKNLTIGDKEFAPGSKGSVRIPVTKDLDGEDISIWINVVRGKSDGPTLAITSLLHGSEWLPVEVIRRVFESLNPAELSGNFIALPVGNPVAFQLLTRPTRDESDSPDLNRSFPGEGNWIAQQLAAAITKNVLEKCTHLIDMHMGLWANSQGTVSYGIDFSPEVSEGARMMAKAYGWPVIKEANVGTVFPGPKSCAGYTGLTLKKPAIGADIGGVGFDASLEEEWININVKGISNVLKHLQIMPGDLELPEKYLIWRNRWRINPKVGGYLHAVSPPTLTRKVSKGEVLGRVISPYNFEVLEELVSPGDGYTMYTGRSYPVRPGDWAFGVVDVNDSHTRWVLAEDY